jgi:hypothetical protein
MSLPRERQSEKIRNDFFLPRHCVGKSKTIHMLDDVSSRGRVFLSDTTSKGAKKRQKKGHPDFSGCPLKDIAKN